MVGGCIPTAKNNEIKNLVVRKDESGCLIIIIGNILGIEGIPKGIIR